MVRRMFRVLCQQQWSFPRTTSVSRRLIGSVQSAVNETPDPVRDRKQISILDERTDELYTPSLSLKPAFNLAAYVNKSDTLQELVRLGVNLHKLEKKPDLAQFILGLKFEQIQPHLVFLHDLGIAAGDLAKQLTKNPGILKEDLADLQIRVNYLQSKKFTKADVKRIVERNPFWLMFTTPRIDTRLGFFQRHFQLTGFETRQLAISHPRLITYSILHVRKAAFTIVEEMGMTKEETKELVLKLPKIITMDHAKTVEKFDYLHNKMGISHRQLVEDPLVFLSRQHRLEQRHRFLRLLGKAQFDRTKPMYVSLTTLVSGTDEEFVINVAKSNLKTYEAFLKTS